MIKTPKQSVKWTQHLAIWNKSILEHTFIFVSIFKKNSLAEIEQTAELTAEKQNYEWFHHVIKYT